MAGKRGPTVGTTDITLKHLILFLKQLRNTAESNAREFHGQVCVLGKKHTPWVLEKRSESEWAAETRPWERSVTT